MMGDVAKAVLPAEEPGLPFIYIDWNAIQHLQNERRFDPLLTALVTARCAGSIAIPYSAAHLLDATAGWTKTRPQHRAERFRNMLFLDGLSSGVRWEIESVPGGVRHLLSNEPVVEACERRGYMASLQADGPLHGAASQNLDRIVADAVATIKATAADAPQVPPQLFDALVESLTGTFQNGLAEISDAGSTFMSVVAPAFLHVADQFPAFDDVPPERAVEHLNRHLAKLEDGFQLDDILKFSMASKPGLVLDDLGPMMLGWLGYNRDRARDVRRAAPGVVPDQTHAKYALASAVFLTGERRLTRRVAAWAAYSGRGEAHGTWPLTYQVSVTDPEVIQAAADAVEAFGLKFPGAATALLNEQPADP